jgi:hypothetical protein
VQHNCAKEKCSIDPRGALQRQEREVQTEIAVPAVSHRHGMKHAILNTHLLRSSHALRGLYGYVTSSFTYNSIAVKAVAKLAVRKRTQNQKKEAAARKVLQKGKGKNKRKRARGAGSRSELQTDEGDEDDADEAQEDAMELEDEDELDMELENAEDEYDDGKHLLSEFLALLLLYSPANWLRRRLTMSRCHP